jgi:hypothetical protein
MPHRGVGPYGPEAKIKDLAIKSKIIIIKILTRGEDCGR